MIRGGATGSGKRSIDSMRTVPAGTAKTESSLCRTLCKAWLTSNTALASAKVQRLLATPATSERTAACPLSSNPISTTRVVPAR